MEDKLTTEDAARELGYALSHVYRLITQGKLKATKIGRVWFIDPEEVDRVKSLQDEHGRLT